MSIPRIEWIYFPYLLTPVCNEKKKKCNNVGIQVRRLLPSLCLLNLIFCIIFVFNCFHPSTLNLTCISHGNSKHFANITGITLRTFLASISPSSTENSDVEKLDAILSRLLRDWGIFGLQNTVKSWLHQSELWNSFWVQQNQPQCLSSWSCSF